MSSSLQQQLAALSQQGAASASSGTAPGLSLASNKRHEEALGRGIHYNLQHGHAVLVDDNVKVKPSVLYATAQEAADVPLETLLDQCRGALCDLASRLDSPALQSSYVPLVVDASTDVPVAVARQWIPQLLNVLTCLLGAEESLSEPCLFILEFLLRRYHVHVHYMQEFLWTFLPWHERRPNLVHRCLLLVDLAATATGSSYLWLRPFATPVSHHATNNNNQTTPPPMVPRALVAQHVMKDCHLLRRLLNVALQCTSSYAALIAGSDNRNTIMGGRGGVQHVYSWTAACLMQGLAWQQTASQGVMTTDAKEAMLRLLAPAVRRACSSTTSNTMQSSLRSTRRSWGYIVASAAAETLDLSDALVEQWAVAMLQPLLLLEGEEEETYDAAWTAVLSLLVPSPNRLPHVQVHPEASFLPLLNQTWLGVPYLPDQLVELVAKSSSSTTTAPNAAVAASSCLGRLHQRLHVAPMVASLLVQAIRHGVAAAAVTAALSTSKAAAGRKAHKKQQRQKAKGDDSRNLVLSLIQEPSLKTLWKDAHYDLLASTTAWIVGEAVKMARSSSAEKDSGNDMSSATVELYQPVLQALHRVDVVACERGLAHALQQHGTANVEIDEGREEEIEGEVQDAITKQLLPKLLEGIVDISAQSNDSDDQKDKTKSDKHLWHLLPTRVALEHAEATVRLDAVQKLHKQVLQQHVPGKENNDDDNNDDDEAMEDADGDVDGDDDDDGESVLQSLLRRWSMDRDVQVATAASRAVCEIFEHSLGRQSSSDRAWCGELTLTGLYHWLDTLGGGTAGSRAETGDGHNEQVPSLLKDSFTIVGHVLGLYLQKSDSDNEEEMSDAPSSDQQEQLLLEALVAHLDGDMTRKGSTFKLKEHVTKAILQAFSRHDAGGGDAQNDLAKRALKIVLSRSEFILSIKNNLKNSQLAALAPSHRKTELAIRRQCLWVVLAALQDDPGKKLLNREDMASLVMRLCIQAVEDENESVSLQKGQESLLGKCLKRCASTLATNNENVPAVVETLVSVGRDKLSPLAKTGLEKLCSQVQNANVSPICVLLESALRPATSSSSVVRLITLARELVASSGFSAAPWLGILPSLALLHEHDDAQVRTAAVALLATIGDSLKKTTTSGSGVASDQKKGNQTSAIDWEPLRRLCFAVKGDSSTASLGGPRFLSKFLSESVGGEDGHKLRDMLLMLCVYSAAAVGEENTCSRARLLFNTVG